MSLSVLKPLVFFIYCNVPYIIILKHDIQNQIIL